MAWARIDDKFLDNPKVRKAGKEAAYLYISALIYSSGEITEGFISDESLGLVAFKGFVKNGDLHAKKLVDCGLWDRIEGGYQIHDYLDYNPTKEEIEQARAKKAAAGRKGGKATAQAKYQADAQAKLQQSSSINPSHPNNTTPLPPLPPQDFQLFAEVYELVTGSEPKVLNAEIEAVQAILEAGGTPDDYRKALQGMQDKDYTISSMASALNWTLTDIEKRKRPARVNNSRKPKVPDMGGYEVDRTSEVVIIDNGEAFDGELQF